MAAQQKSWLPTLYHTYSLLNGFFSKARDLYSQSKEQTKWKSICPAGLA